MKRFLTIAASAAFAVLANAEEPRKDADNTGKNERDKTGETKTPLDQSNDPADVKTTRDIRLAVMGDNELTAMAKNVKIITTSGGKVTLRGPVKTAEEKTKIGRLAEGIAGEGKVENQIEVKAAK